jgi:two-component system, OmpR family, KDP operon response regulator KdpE
MQSNKPHVVLIEDDAPLQKHLRTLLGGAGYRVEAANNGTNGLELARAQKPALIVLDLGLPDIDGQSVLLMIRQEMDVPVVVLSARNDPFEKINALDNGADDYLTKPFNSGELLARLRLALRHHSLGQSAEDTPVFQFGDLRINLFDHQTYVNECEVHLTPIEFKLLSYLARHVGKVVTYQALLNAVWGTKRGQSAQNVRVFIAGLRRKIEPDPAHPRHLITEQGIGYRLLSEPSI